MRSSVDGMTRRGLLLIPVPRMALRLVKPVENATEDLEYRNGRLSWSGGSAMAAAGRAGVRANKTEGDGATPSGSYPLVFGLYRRDRIEPPPSRAPLPASGRSELDSKAVPGSPAVETH